MRLGTGRSKVKAYPNFSIEEGVGGTVVGVDEVGRGSLAGPVMAAAVILDKRALGMGIDDSKKLSKAKRETLYAFLVENFTYAVAAIGPVTIDGLNILNATMLAMQKAIAGIEGKYSSIIVDGNRAPVNAPNVYPVIGGDGMSLTIAAASIIAKVERDRLMTGLAQGHRAYGWERNAGYGTKEHIGAIAAFGICNHHRVTFTRHLIPSFKKNCTND